MDADEIRRVRMNSETDNGRFQCMVAMLQEIAAQLADLNQHLRTVDAAVFGSPKK